MNIVKAFLGKVIRNAFSLMYNLEALIPYTFTSKLQYFYIMRKRLNLKDPQSLNEKIQWLKAFYREPMLAIGADKYAVRDHMIEKGLKQYLIPLYGVYDSVDEIDLNKLPDQFVLKINNTCGKNLFVKDKNRLNFTEEKLKINHWLKDKYWLKSGEMQYRAIKPKIIIEKYLVDKRYYAPLDYKFYCFNGEVKFLRIGDNNESMKDNKFIFVDLNWNKLPYLKKEFQLEEGLYLKPKNFDDMLKIAKTLSADFPLVRVDMYNIEGKIYLGELTLTPSSGYDKFFNEASNLEVGSYLKLPKKFKRK